jgi:hypothetical protein
MRSRVRSIAARVEEDMNARTKGRLTAADRRSREGLPGDPAVLLEGHHDIARRVGHAHPHRHPEAVAQGEPTCSGAGTLHGARAVDLGVPGRVGEQVEDRLGRGGYDA